MRFLGTADWQTQFSNIPQCEELAQKILHLIKKRDLEAVVVAGDLKDRYNPVDMRVIEFWVQFVKEIRILKADALLILGNHDRTGMHQDDKNWLFVLQNAGAEVFWQANGKRLDGGNLYVLPFVGTPDRLERECQWLYDHPTNPEKDVLAFHLTLKGSKFSKFGQIADPSKGVPIEILRPERYRYCLGGDIHLPQRVTENVWYMGSPAPWSWGEVNQEKVFAIVTEKGLEWVPTGMPGWYDPGIDGFKPPKDWKGTRVRISVPVYPGEDFGRRLAEERIVASKKYQGAQISTIPDVQDSREAAPSGIDPNLPENEQIRSYIRSVLPEDSKDQEDQVVAYIAYKTKRTGIGMRLDTSIRFLRAWGEKFLSFEKVELLLDSPGLVVVSGRNLNWPGRSNGSGKTSLVSLIPIALFGKNLKGQMHDEWAQEDSKGTCRAGIEWMTAEGHKVRVERTRRPSTVRLWMNDKEISSGNRPELITKDIETLCGYSWDMLTSLIYISKEEQSFLQGTQKQKQETLAKLQNLNRFSAARKIVGEDMKKTRLEISGWMHEVEILEASISNVKDQGVARISMDRAKKRGQEIIEELSQMILPNLDPLKKRSDDAQNEVSKLNVLTIALQNKEKDLQDQIQKIQRLPNICPTCKQPIKRDRKVLEEHLFRHREELKVIQEQIVVAKEKMKPFVLDAMEKRQLYADAMKTRYQLEQKQILLKEEKERCVREFNHWKKYAEEEQAKIEETKESIQAIKSMIAVMEEDLMFLEFAASLLDRDGIPAYLSQMQCPRLNQAGKYYSEKFSEGEIQVRFSMKDGLIETEMLNANGGQTLKGQSDGEGGLASLATSFAIRRVGLKSNVLVLDEPGDGLDDVNGKVFASALREMDHEFGTIFLISHSNSILSELTDVKNLLVEKEDKVSRVKEIG